ncbi:hypothetical protein DPMN_067181 [Dreissena polymorpha]|uniref:Uncharacterized protein n=1 Tax=Dreissena polymorpha TaxID=45954 RepID=A0A9D3YZ59_DREPO|nr:hypothetical protein DPMN_067181 [Dreissena polymorpha]
MSRKPVSANYYSTDSDSADTPERPQRDLSWPARYERINVDGNHLRYFFRPRFAHNTFVYISKFDL